MYESIDSPKDYPQDHGPDFPDGSTDHGWGYGDMPGVTAQDPTDPDRADFNDDQPPDDFGGIEDAGPDVTPPSDGSDRPGPPGPPTPGGGEGTQDPDDAGVSLHRILDFTSLAYERVRPAVEAEVSPDYLQPPEEGDLSAQPDLDDPDWTSLEHAVDRDYQAGMLLYADALERVGMQFARGSDGGSLYPMIVDPGRYCAALRRMQLPDSAEAIERIITENNTALLAALSDTYKGMTNPGDLLAAEAQDHLAAELPGQAHAIADVLVTIPANSHVVRSYRQLGTAEQEGLLDVWADAFGAQAIGHSYVPMGQGRLDDIPSWNAVYRLIDTLAEHAPNATFTRQVRDNLLEDIDASLLRPLNSVVRQLLRQASTVIRERLR